MNIEKGHIVLTGATGGIGRALAIEIDSRGGVLTLVGRDQEGLQQLNTHLSTRHNLVVADLCTTQGRAHLIQNLSALGRSVDALINNAGTMGRNISPEWVESELLNQSGIDQAMVYGDAQTTLSALIVSELDQHQVRQCVAAANLKLPAYARIGDWKLVTHFTAMNGQLTNNGKIKRDAVMEYHSAEHCPDITEKMLNEHDTGC